MFIIIVRAKSLQSCPTLCDSVDCSPPGSSVHGILQPRILERVAISFSRESSRKAGLKEARAGIKIGGKNINNLRYEHHPYGRK